MWSFAKETILNNKKVNLDPVLAKILNLPKLDKKLFAEIREDENFYSH